MWASLSAVSVGKSHCQSIRVKEVCFGNGYNDPTICCSVVHCVFLVWCKSILSAIASLTTFV